MLTDKGALDPGGSEAVAAFRLLFTVSARLRARMDRLLAPITTQQAAVLTVIGAGAPSMSEVAAALSTTHQNVKQVALALERKGFVRIEGDPRDGRVRRLVATKKSARHWARRDPGDHEQTATWFDALDAGELTALVATLRKLEASLRREPARGLPAGDASLHSAAMPDAPPPPAARIVGFHEDAEGHAVADLACGHAQHMRHRPPLESRPWALTAEGRASKLGASLPCPACRMPRLPPGLAEYKRTATYTRDTVPAGLLKAHTLKAGTWGELVVLEGHVRYVLEAQGEVRGDALVVLSPELAGVIAPEAPHRVEVPAGARFFVRFLR